MSTVTILQRRQMVRPDEAGIARPFLAITYAATAFPPRTVFVPEGEASDERVAQAIREDMDAVLSRRPETLDV